MAATYHWTPRQLEAQLTDEQFVLLLDEQADTVRDRTRADFDRMVEAVRAGTIFAHDGKQHEKWIRSTRKPQQGLSGAALEAAVMRVAALFPSNVERVMA